MDYLTSDLLGLMGFLMVYGAFFTILGLCIGRYTAPVRSDSKEHQATRTLLVAQFSHLYGKLTKDASTVPIAHVNGRYKTSPLDEEHQTV